ncbi:winged helix-turn-helix transcriptional regulator [bacterium]|nr:winged helix-turn-helix transcriptional regulator [bacterium]
MLNDQEKRVIQLFKMLGNATRYKIIRYLLHGEVNVTSLAEMAGKSMSTVSRHLRFLHELDILAYRTENNNVFYKVKKKCLGKLIEDGLKCIERDPLE